MEVFTASKQTIIMCICAFSAVYVLIYFQWGEVFFGRQATSLQTYQKISRPRIKFQYCYSSEFYKIFLRYGKIIRDTIPGVELKGEYYSLPVYRVLIGKLLDVAQILSVICIIKNLNICPYLHLKHEQLWLWCLKNKILSCSLIIFTANFLISHIVSTGAFEIFLNDTLVWSKLNRGYLPEPTELSNIIKKLLQQ